MRTPKLADPGIRGSEAELRCGLLAKLGKDGWTPGAGGSFCTEISNRPKGCPKCGAAVWEASVVRVERDREGDILSTSRTCRCGALLVIFND